VRKISFTGSVAGQGIMGYAVEDLSASLELGGNDPAIVLDDVDERDRGGLFWSAFRNSGRVCTAIKRLYVHEDYRPILRGLVDRAKKVRVGDGADRTARPISNKMQLRRSGLVEDAKKRTAARSGRAGPASRIGCFHRRPSSGIGAGVRLVDEGAFGTALPVIPYSISTMCSSRRTARTTGSAARCGQRRRGHPAPGWSGLESGPAG
jgi:acyl-CoA reductase-like NAD-dependent aldehyde dehydrogenase